MVETVASQVSRFARERPDDVAVTFLENGESLETALSYAALERAAIDVARGLLKLGRPGDRVLLAFRSGLPFIEAFLGCLYAGMVAVPVHPPRARGDGSRLVSVARDSGCVAVLSSADLLPLGRQLFALNPATAPIPWMALPGADFEGPAWPAARPPAPEADSIAFLQYTSGSTAEPKGVAVSHANLRANFLAIKPAMAIGPSTVFLSWLPLNHDMGLIGIVLQALFSGNRFILMSPAHFLQRPLRWLAAISKYRATLSGAPNFAFDLCVRRISDEQRDALDLSSWKVAFNGAEPVRADTLERFSDKFAACGFSKTAFFPCYGLAETTLYASGGRANVPAVAASFDKDGLARGRAIASSAAGGVALVGCGKAAAGHEIVVVCPHEHVALEEGRVGEIWLRGPSVARAYWNAATASSVAFEARLANGDGPFLRTGDLGFLLNGEVFVSGRIKDLIIVRGRNIHPQDVEMTAEQVSTCLVPAGGAAFSDGAAQERFVVVHEVRGAKPPDLDELGRLVTRAVLDAHEVQPHRVVLIRAGSLPKTTSGKVRRAAAREALAAGLLPVLHEYRADRSDLVEAAR